MGWGFTHGAVDDFVGGGEADRFTRAVHRDIDHDRQHGFGVTQRQFGEPPVCTENSNSDIMVMQSAKDRVGMDTASSLNWARERRVLI